MERRPHGITHLISRIKAWLLLWPGRDKFRLRPVAVLAVIGIVVFFMVTAAAVITLAGSANTIDNGCGQAQFGCNAGIELVGTIVTVVFAFASLAYWRVFKVANVYRQKARKNPWGLFEAIPPSEADGKIIGRDGVCEILEKDLRDHESRAQLVIGPIGVGKTALLVHLTQHLAMQGAIPVPIRLRDAPEQLDFNAMAKERFRQTVEPKLLTIDEGDKIWKKLCEHRRVVVLADGLEEALANSSAKRAPAIRVALDNARKDRIPLVVTTRPDDELVGVDAAVIRLGPLEAEEVIRHLGTYVTDARPEEIRTLATKAEIAELPFYLRVARELSPQLGSMNLGRPRPRLRLRVELLNRWVEGLVHGDVARSNAYFIDGERRDAVEIVERIACQTIKDHTLEIRFADLEESPIRNAGEEDVTERAARGIAPIAERIELMERVPGGLRFQHSMVQAYLAGRRLRSILKAESRWQQSAWLRFGPRRERHSYLDDALATPSRELLIALVLCCSIHDDTRMRKNLRDRLLKEAQRPLHQGTPTGFDLLGAAYEIDVMLKGDGATELLEISHQLWNGSEPPDALRSRVSVLTPKRWSNTAAPDPWSVTSEVRMVEAKLRAVDRMGEAWNAEAYRALWDVCLQEDNYRVRLHAAQTLGTSGNRGFKAIQSQLDKALERAPKLVGDHATTTAKAEDVRRASVQGWLLPLFAATCTADEAAAACRNLDRWVTLAEQQDLHVGVETCFAQGFKFQANRQRQAESEEQLLLLAGRLLDSTGWWYSQICLLQSLALSSLDSADAEARLANAIQNFMYGAAPHPFVAAAAQLCSEVTPDPEPDPPSRFLWIDEAGVAARVGPVTARSDSSLWIPQAAGWLSLRERDARQLVADVLMYLNLIEGGNRVAADIANGTVSAADQRVRERERRRRRVREQGASVPRCIASVSHHKDLNAQQSACGCAFDLCPYPAYEDHPFRGELYETFCRGQQRMVKGFGGRVPAWREGGVVAQAIPWRQSRALGRFWTEMEDRAKEPMAGAVDV
jgi:hypothetical protein